MSAEFAAYVVSSEQGLGICIPAQAKKPYYVDFYSVNMAYRSAKSQQQNELIVRACRIKSLERPSTIVDATAGFGRDAFILASSGFTVSMIERHPVIAALLAEGLAKINDDALKARLTLCCADSHAYLKKLSAAVDKPDVIYLDPMFAIKRQAKVKKDLQVLQILLDDTPDDSNILLPLAVQAAARRVVVKRPIEAAPLNNQTPTFSLLGKQIRFDIYVRF